MTKINTEQLENWDLIQLGEYLNVKQEYFKLLLQAYRIKNLTDKPKTYKDVLGMGSSSVYKCKYFKVHGEKKEKMTNSFILTDSGVTLLKTIEEYIPVPHSTKSKEKINSVFYRFK